MILKRFLTGAITGSALAYFFDPQRGTLRRDTLRHRLGLGEPPTDEALLPSDHPAPLVTPHTPTAEFQSAPLA